MAVNKQQQLLTHVREVAGLRFTGEDAERMLRLHRRAVRGAHVVPILGGLMALFFAVEIGLGIIWYFHK